ncbi:NAD-dependent epimerase/dehydratase family protein [Psychrobacillus glaciei]|uniref:NAD-dependent epimerase/dehydratase family protein n=1 Tax=Psychrobacillus glaciei TaxID=2283160 RepID=A0A5J6SIM7_9BACI|nr:NAD(P)H-binding protein [Psychrobacillus glaciei]QFF97429.1 NAD-dependent epimerase/dehydratase family protein [Psychrobacillus glaciei]
MKIALFGATGRVGKEILSLLLKNNDEITALVRTPEKLQNHPNLTFLQGDARVFADVEKTLAGADAVISALGTDQSTVLTESVEHIISIMEKQKIKRVVTIGTAGILTSQLNPTLLRYESSESKRKSQVAAKEHHKVYEMLKGSGLDWTIVCPTYLPTGAVTKAYIIERNQLPLGAVKSTTGDTALFAFNELLENKHIGYRVGIMSPN